MRISDKQLEQVNSRINALITAGSFYGKKLSEAGITRVDSADDFEKLPFSEKNDLRDAYPLGLMTAPEEEIVRIHSSSGTTGLPVIIPYTAKDVDDWAIQFKRCYEFAGITNKDRIQITPGYGLWTAGIGFQNGAEKLGAMVIPMGPGNTEKQLKMMVDMESTVICATSSYALLLAEEIQKRGIKDQIKLKKGVIGSERWGEKMRERIKNELGSSSMISMALQRYTAPVSVLTVSMIRVFTIGTTLSISRSLTLRQVNLSKTDSGARSLSQHLLRKARLLSDTVRMTCPG